MTKSKGKKSINMLYFQPLQNHKQLVASGCVLVFPCLYPELDVQRDSSEPQGKSDICCILSPQLAHNQRPHPAWDNISTTDTYYMQTSTNKAIVQV